MKQSSKGPWIIKLFQKAGNDRGLSRSGIKGIVEDNMIYIQLSGTEKHFYRQG